MDRCPGQYCGRTLYDNGSWSDCGACERGYRVNESYLCAPCRDELNTYSWLYLGFMAMLPLMLHCFFIDLHAKDRKFSRKQLILTACAFIEVALSATLSILLMEPMWEFRLHSCGVRNFTDWYTLFYNPSPNYETRLHCTQEAVYPLQTIVLVFYFLCLSTMFLIRPIVSAITDVRGKSPIYAALYFLPLLTSIHALACGLIYWFFPYLSIGISMITNAIHYSVKLDQSFKALIRSSLLEIKNFVIISVHWLLLAYGIIALGHHYAFLCLIPFPSIFYILTVRFTDPAEFREVENFSLVALESYYVGKEREVNENICKALDVAEITLADTTLNFSAAHVNFSFNAKPAAPEKTRYSVSIFDQIEVQPQQRRSKSNSVEQTSIMKFVARSILLLLAETTPTNSVLLQLRTMFNDDIEKEAAVEDFFLSLEQLIKAKMHDVWYIMVQYILDYQKRYECNIISTDFVSLHLTRVFRNVMLNKDVNFIDLFVMLIADKNKESLLELLNNDLKTDQQRINLLTLYEMYNVHLEGHTQVEAIRNKRLKQFYYMEFCKQDPSIKGKFNVDTDNIQQLLRLFHNKKLDVKLLERMSDDFNLDYQQMLITQVKSILLGQELKYEIKTDTFGEEELVVLSSVSGIRNLCQPYLHAIKDADSMASKLIQFFKEINIYFYELYLYVIEMLSYFDKMPKEMQIWTSMLHFLKHKMIKRRRNRPGPLETDMWLQSQSEMGVMPKIARFRLPFKPIVEQPLKDILDNELSVDNCESWFPLMQMHTVLKGSNDVAKVRDYLCMSAVKNSIAEYKTKNESEIWHLQPTNNAFLQSILRLVKHVTNPSKTFMILYFVANYAPDGADQVEASYECYKYALAHEELITNEKYQDQLVKIKRKYPILKTQHLLYIYGLTDEKLLRLVEHPAELIYSLYHHELILKSSKLDINTVAKEIAVLHGLDLQAIQFQLLQKWLAFTVDAGSANMLEETFFEDHHLAEEEETNAGNASENVIRANYILNSWPKQQAIEFLVAHIFPADGSVNTSKQLQMYECFSKLNDGSESFKNILSQKQYITIKCVHELKQLGYNSSLEKFTNCNKIDILKTIWQRNAQNPHTLEILANICLGFDIFHSKIWNGILKRMAMFNMVRELDALVDVLSCEPKLLHTEGLIVAWECVLWQPFKTANQTRSFEQEEVLQKALFRLQSCPIVHKLNLFEFAELCINLERPHMAAVAMALCRDVGKRYQMKKMILHRKNEQMRKDLLDLEDAGLLSVILNFAQKELEL